MFLFVSIYARLFPFVRGRLKRSKAKGGEVRDMEVGFGSGFALPTRTKPGPSAHLALAPVAEALWGPHARGGGRKAFIREEPGREFGEDAVGLVYAVGGARFCCYTKTTPSNL